MIYNIVYTESAKVVRRVWAKVEASSEEEVDEKVRDGDVDVLDCVDLYDDGSELRDIESINTEEAE